MRLRRSFGIAALVSILGASAAYAQPLMPQKPLLVAQASVRDYFSYYTYYKAAAGDTTASIASKFGLAESSLIRMNPYLTQYDTELPVGTLVSVPQAHPSAEEQEAEVASTAKAKPRSEVQSLPSRKATSASTSKASTKPLEKRRSKTAMDAQEWETLAELCTNGAPVPPARASMVIEAPPSRLIRSNGEVVYIPAAKPRVAAKKVVPTDDGGGKLTTARAKAILAMVKTGRSFMGIPYVWGGEDPSGFDCSGYIQYVFAKHGKSMPRTADIQFNVGQVVPRGQEKPGDLVFFETYCPGPSHVGIYLGRDYFMHASSSRGVTVDRLSSDFFAARYLGAKRNF